MRIISDYSQQRPSYAQYTKRGVTRVATLNFKSNVPELSRLSQLTKKGYEQYFDVLKIKWETEGALSVMKGLGKNHSRLMQIDDCRALITRCQNCLTLFETTSELPKSIMDEIKSLVKAKV